MRNLLGEGLITANGNLNNCSVSNFSVRRKMGKGGDGAISTEVRPFQWSLLAQTYDTK